MLDDENEAKMGKKRTTKPQMSERVNVASEEKNLSLAEFSFSLSFI